MFKTLLVISLSCLFSACVVLPEKDLSEEKLLATHYQCELSTDQKTLKLVSLTDGDSSFYAWNDEIFAIITVPTSAIISATYVLVNNIYYIGEKQIKCSAV